MRGESAAVGYHMHGFSAWHAHACTLSAVVRHYVRCACTASVVWLTMHARYWWHQLLSPNACAVSASVKHCMHGIGSCHTLHVLYQPCQTLHVPYLFASAGVTYGMRDIILLLKNACVVTECISYGHPPHTQCQLLSSTTRTSCCRTPCMRGITLLSRTLCMRGISCCSTLHARCHFYVEHCMRGISCCHTRHVRYQVVSRIARAVSGANRQCSRINR